MPKRITCREDYPRDAELCDFIDAARNEGWRVEITNGGHMRFLPKDRSMPPVYGPQSPSDWRSMRNMRSKLRRGGLPV